MSMVYGTDTDTSGPPGRDPRPLLRWLVLIPVLGGLILLSASHPEQAPPMDDTYIHLTYARNMAEDGLFMQFSPGTPSSGTTSPLWTFVAILAVPFGDSAPLALMLLSSILGAIAILLSGRLHMAAPLLLTGPFLFHASSGMETSLAVLVVVLFHLGLGEDARKRSSTTYLSVLLAVAVLTRPELALLAIPAMLQLRRRGIRAGGILIMLLPAFALGALWMAWNIHTTGSPLPAAFHAKIGSSGPVVDPSGLLKGMLLASPGLLLLLPLSIAQPRSRTFPRSLTAPLLLLAALATQPNGFFQMRYYLPFLAAAALSVSSSLRQSWRKPWLYLGLILLSLPGLVVLTSRRLRASIDVDYIDRSPAILLDAVAEDDAMIACSDAGAAGWFATGPDRPGRTLIDLDGLVSPDVMETTGSERWRFILDNADYLLAFPVQYQELLSVGEGNLEVLAFYSSPSPVICGEDRVLLFRIR